MTIHHGSCHCGAIRYEVDVSLEGKATKCNCTLCTKMGVTGTLVRPEAFKLLQGQDAISTYTRHPEVGFRSFCKHCGIHCFATADLPEMGGKFVSLVVNTLDDLDPHQLTIGYFDGRHDNWMAGLRPSPWPI